jgi:hypothetical protein
VLTWPLILIGTAALPQLEGPVTLEVGKVAATVSPGEQVEVPITLVAPEATPVSRISFEIGYSPQQIFFISFQTGPAGDDAHAQLEVRSRDSEEGDQILIIDISAEQALPEGVLCTLTFEIPEGTELGSRIPVRNLKQTAETQEGQTLEVAGEDGYILFLGFLPACFFYMH